MSTSTSIIYLYLHLSPMYLYLYLPYIYIYLPSISISIYHISISIYHVSISISMVISISVSIYNGILSWKATIPELGRSPPLWLWRLRIRCGTSIHILRLQIQSTGSACELLSSLLIVPHIQNTPISLRVSTFYPSFRPHSNPSFVPHLPGLPFLWAPLQYFNSPLIIPPLLALNPLHPHPSASSRPSLQAFTAPGTVQPRGPGPSAFSAWDALLPCCPSSVK